MGQEARLPQNQPWHSDNSNPFAPPSTDTVRRQGLSEQNQGVCTHRGLLHATIEFQNGTRFEYTGLNFRQRIRINRRTVWWCITWVWFEKRISFRAPWGDSSEPRSWLVEVDIGRRLKLARLRILVEGEEVYLEWAK